MSRLMRAVLPSLGLAFLAVLPALAQTGGANTGGVERLVQQQRLASSGRRVLMIGAHPDDEATELLAIFARGMGIRTAYLALTRGDGGQNLASEELGEALGVLRTEELQDARRIDGAQQFFTRAFDFGFSKTSDESLLFWNRDSLLKDMVRVIRRFRPQIIVSVFTGTPADGHGHHQVAGLLTPEAYRIAGDPGRFPELLTQEGLAAWAPSKLYRVARGGAPAGGLAFDGGEIDPASGMSMHQIAARSRSQHRSQNQGALEELGPSRDGLQLVTRLAGIPGADDSLFAGISAEPVDSLSQHAREFRLTESGVVLDATTDDDEVTAGQVLAVRLSIWNTGQAPVRAGFVIPADRRFDISPGTCTAAPQPIAPRALVSCGYTVTVRADAALSEPYWLTLPRQGAMFQWAGDPHTWGEPEAAPVSAGFSVQIGDAPAFVATREVLARFRDPVLGEVRRPIFVVPAIALDLQPNIMLWSSDLRTRKFNVSLEHLARDSSDATVALAVPKGWTVTPPQVAHFTQEGERGTAQFTVTAPAGIVTLGPISLQASATTAQGSYSSGVYRMRYDYVRATNMITKATAHVVVADVHFPGVGPIGYVRGGGDRVPEAMLNAGVPVVVLAGDSLERGSFDRYRVIVIGSRAYEADASLLRANPRLLRWLNDGGTLVIQYQQTPYMRGGYAPRRIDLGSPTQNRVTDERAPVAFLAPTHQVLNWPNKIGPGDFDDWVQDRGLDYAAGWDSTWTPVLEMHDAGDVPQRGGLLVAHVGRGTAVYTALAFNRQLPLAIPGAWRLFANMLALGQHPVPARARSTSH
jgi:LmbE family N-acetylglucosaminyl deacetylase